MLLKLLFDVAVLTLILYALLGNEAPEFSELAWICLGILVANVACVLLLAGLMGAWVAIPVALIDGVILMFFAHLTIKYAAIAVAALFVYNIAYYFLIHAIAG